MGVSKNRGYYRKSLDLNNKSVPIIMPRNDKTSAETEVLQKNRVNGPEIRRNNDVPILYQGRFSRKKEFDMFEENSGFISIPRHLINDSRIEGIRLKYKKVFDKILQYCCYKEQTFSINGNLITLRPGQLCASFDQIVIWTNKGVRFKEDLVDKNIVQRSVSLLFQFGLVIQEVIHGKSVITITIPGLYGFKKTRTDTGSDTKVIQNRYTNKEREESIKKTIPTLPKGKKVFFPKIERIGWVKTSEQEHKKLIELKGSEEAVYQIYHDMSEWKGRKFANANAFKLAMDWEVKKTKKYVTEEHKQIAEKISEKFKKNRDIVMGSSYIEFNHGSSNVHHIKFGENGFLERVKNCLIKMNLDVSFLKSTNGVD